MVCCNEINKLKDAVDADNGYGIKIDKLASLCYQSYRKHALAVSNDVLELVTWDNLDWDEKDWYVRKVLLCLDYPDMEPADIVDEIFLRITSEEKEKDDSL